MFQEALQAVQAGDRGRARDLLTRLLKIRQDHVDYWLWMSAVVDTQKEKIFCLKEALRLDPQNSIAKRGLTILGVTPPDSKLVVPLRLQRRSWQPALPGGSSGGEARASLPAYQLLLVGAALIALVILLSFAIRGVQDRLRPRRPVINLPMITQSVAIGSTSTITPTFSGSPAPLWMSLVSTYTPTPLYVNTPHAVSEAYHIGLRALSRGDLKDAGNYFRQAATEVAKNEPAAVDVEYYIAEDLRLQGKLTDALKVYQQVLKRDPDFAPAYLGRARTLQALNEKNNAEQVEADLRSAIKADPKYIEAYQDLMVFLAQAKRAEDVLVVMRSGSDLLEQSAIALTYQAHAYLQLGEIKKALDSARRANELDITLLLPYRLIGEALQAQGDVLDSLEPLEIYTRYERKDPQAWLLLSKVYIEGHRFTEAMRALDQLILIDDSLPGVYLLRADLNLERESPEDALSDYQAALRAAPDSFEASIGIGKALMALEYPGDAWDRFERTRTLAVTELHKSELLFWRGQSLEQLGEWRAALRDYQELVALPAENVKEEWVEYARVRIAALATPTPISKPGVATMTPAGVRQPSKTPTPTRIPTKKP